MTSYPMERGYRLHPKSQGKNFIDSRLRSMNKKFIDYELSSEHSLPSRQTLLPLNQMQSLQFPPGSLQKGIVQDLTMYEADPLTNFVSLSPPKTTTNDRIRFKRGNRCVQGSYDLPEDSGAIFTRNC